MSKEIHAEKNAAMYLRCYPADPWNLPVHQAALRRFATALGFDEVALYLDNGLRATDPLIDLERLRRAVRGGIVHVVLVPGPWVFHPDPGRARAIRLQLSAEGCVTVELPPKGCLVPAPRQSAGLP
ncbi:hypothetical protein ABZ615_10635 [Streptomyces sp. NPDC007325]|uniref:hypothetical protein n=1 Tax=Streptomyces sp. NPDC007325 TaxID=3154588 RepID=UPI0033C10B6F